MFVNDYLAFHLCKRKNCHHRKRHDAIQYPEFSVPAGKKVELEFKNVGKLPKIAMGHNLVILKEGVSALSFSAKVLQAGGNATNALPESVMEEVLAHTKLLGPGESETITFTAPEKAGAYQFVCTFPGHYAMMRGIMNVK